MDTTSSVLILRRIGRGLFPFLFSKRFFCAFMHRSIYKINWKRVKKENERMFADFFVKRFNKTYNLNYSVIPNSKEDDIDIRAVAKDDEILNLQLKTGEPEFERFLGTRIKHGSGMTIIDSNIEERLNQIIRNGESQYPSSPNLILLITEKHQPVFGATYALHIANKLSSTTFRGVYIVKLPAFDTIHPYEGQIVAIKDIFGNHGIIF